MQPLELSITSEAYLKLKYFISECPTEISGFGKVREIESSLFENDITEYEEGSSFSKDDGPMDGRFFSEDKNIEDVGFNMEKKAFGSLGFRSAVPKNHLPLLDNPLFPGKKGSVHLQIYDFEILPQIVSAAHASMKTEDVAKFIGDKMKNGKSTKDYKVWWHSHVEMDAFFSGTDTGTIDDSSEFPYLISIVGNKRSEFKCRIDFYKPNRMAFEMNFTIEDPVSETIRKACVKEIEAKVEKETFFPRMYLPKWGESDKKKHKKNKKSRQ